MDNSIVSGLKLTSSYFLLSLLIVCGTDTVSSDDVATTDAHVNIHVTAGNTGNAYINIELRPDGPASTTSIELSKSDQLWASNDEPFSRNVDTDNLFSELNTMASNSIKLHQGGVFNYGFLDFRIYGEIWYSGLIPASNDDTYYVSLLRDSFQSAADSRVTIPSKFSVTAPLSNETHSRSNDLTINWQSDLTSLPVSISVFTTCLNNVNDTFDIENLSDTGSYTLAAANFTPAAVGICNTNIEVVKANLGQLDPLFNSGIIAGNRVSKAIYTSTD